jgi:hypothetical protein
VTNLPLITGRNIEKSAMFNKNDVFDMKKYAEEMKTE